MPPTFHIASLNPHTPKFSGVGLKLTSTVCRPGPSKVRKPRFVSTEIGLFELFFLRKQTKTWPKGQFLRKACWHILKAIAVRVNFGYLGTLYVHHMTRQIFMLHRGREMAPLAETLSIISSFPRPAIPNWRWSSSWSPPWERNIEDYSCKCRLVASLRKW